MLTLSKTNLITLSSLNSLNCLIWCNFYIELKSKPRRRLKLVPLFPNIVSTLSIVVVTSRVVLAHFCRMKVKTYKLWPSLVYVLFI